MSASTSRATLGGFETAQKRINCARVAPGAFFLGRRVQLVALATQHRGPDDVHFASYVEAGGLMSYGPDLPTPIARPAPMPARF